MPSQFEPPSGTRDLLAAEVEERERAFAEIRSVFSRYGFEPLQTPAFERLDVLMGKYGEDGEKLVFKILRRGEHEASGEADLALRYDHTVPLARVAAAYGSRLPSPYKRYALGPVWRADRPGRDRYREFVQCDLDSLGSSSILADAEALCAQHDALAAVGLSEFSIQLNSRRVLAGLLEAFGVGADIGPGVLITLDKLDRLPPDAVVAELAEDRGLATETAAELVAAVTAADGAERIRSALKPSEEGAAGLAEVDDLLALVTPELPPGRIAFTPRLVRGLSYYTGPIWEVAARGVAGSIGSGGRYDHLIEQLGGPDVPATGSSIGLERILTLRRGTETASASRLDVAVTVMGEQLAGKSFALAAAARAAGLRASVYLGRSQKLGRQLSWANDVGARWCLIYGSAEAESGTVTVRDMRAGEQAAVPLGEVRDYLAGAAGQPGR
jgi:histidyl-tRNA synthetase